MRRFPSGRYGRQLLQFHPAPFRAPLRAFAALAFVWEGDRVLLCDIVDRGWSVPSGRVEPDEDSREAVIREAQEEAGALLTNLMYIGCYQIFERREIRWADCFSAQLGGLVDIPAGTESRGRRLATFEELPEVYHLWNSLTEEVFRHSYEVVQRSLGS